MPLHDSEATQTDTLAGFSLPATKPPLIARARKMTEPPQSPPLYNTT